ncbi:MAG: diguanylate cyclase [Acidobacteria bacterium]|nr:diguanylate cyclase [Acidobacteriota bacterium]
MGCALVVAGLLAGSAGAVRASQPETLDDPYAAGTRSVRVFRDADGLPQNTVHAITTDLSGVLWVGTQDGAASYDGRRWAVADMPNRTRSNFVRVILASADGSLWFGTQASGLCRLKDGTWSVVPVGAADGGDLRVNALLESRHERGGAALWVATHDRGLARLRAGVWTLFDTSTGLPHNRVWGLAETVDEAGTVSIWAGTEGGLARLDAGSDRFAPAPGFPGGSVNSVLDSREADGSRTLWVGTYGQGLVRLNRGVWTTLRAADGMPSDFVTSLRTVADSTTGAIWAGTDGGGVARIEGGAVQRVLDIGTGLPSNAVYALFETTAETGVRALWVGTRNGGLARVKDDQWRSFQPIPQPAALPVTCLLETRENGGAPAMWFGTDGGGLARLLRGAWTVFDRRSGALPSDYVTCLLASEDRPGEPAIWVGTRNGGLARYAGGRWQSFTMASGALPNDLVQTLLETVHDDGSRTLWVGTRQGLAAHHRGTWRTVKNLPLGAETSVLSLLETRSPGGVRTLWVGTFAGLARFENDSWRTYTTSAGLLNDTIQTLHATTDSGGGKTLWAGTDGGGVGLLDLGAGNGKFTALTDASSPALPNNVVYQILEDRSGQLYLLTNKGVARLTPRDREGSGPRFDVFTFTVEDGLPLHQCNRGAGIVDRRGRVWVGTVGGAAVLDPVHAPLDTAPKRLLLTGSLPEQPERRLDADASLAYDEDHVVFDYALLSLFREGDTRYRTQLAPLDGEPSAWLGDTNKEYRTLPQGSYVFRVWGRDYAGNVSGPVELAFTVRPAPWLTWWAYSLALALLAAAVVTIIRIRLHRHRRREEELIALVDARTRELAEANEFLMELSYLDPLTGIANRRRFGERLEHEWKRAVRGKNPVSLVMIDIDGFKAFNDAYGHPRGDECLRSVATTLADGLPRAGDSVARYGGEEFVVILPFTDRSGAVKVAEQLRHRIEGLGIPNRASTVGKVVTISCGVATFVPAADIEMQELIRLADEALYRAKQRGKNRTAAEHGEPRSSVVVRPRGDDSGSLPPVT